MKFFKSTLAIVALFAIGSVNARMASGSAGAKPTPAAAKPAPTVKRPLPSIPLTDYAQIENRINAEMVSLVETTDTFNANVNMLANKSNLSVEDKNALLRTAINLQKELVQIIQKNNNQLAKGIKQSDKLPAQELGRAKSKFSQAIMPKESLLGPKVEPKTSTEPKTFAETYGVPKNK